MLGLREHAYTRLSLILFTTVTLGLSHAVSAASNLVVKKDFPRLGGMQIGKSLYEANLADPAYRAEIAKLDYAIINRSTTTLTDYAKDIKRRNPNIILAKYQNIAEVRLNPNSFDTMLRQKLDTEKGPNKTNAFDWWLRDANGDRLSLWPNTYRVNLSEYVKPDANGERWPQWRAKIEYDANMKDPVWDGWYMDLTNWIPKFKGGPVGDYSGGQVSGSEHNVAYRRAHRAYWDAIRKLTPDRLILVNHNWYDYDSNDTLDLGHYKGANGGYLEYKMDWDENNRDWDKIYTWYRRSMTYFVDPKVVLFDARGRPGDYQFFRYAFATCLMADGFFEYSPNNQYQKGSVLWFDEFDLAGSSNTKWMGQPISPPPNDAWRSGVYRRDFENAVVLVNPKQNGRVTVSVEDGLTRISGKQDPIFNNGRKAQSITLQAGDGIILIRNSSISISAHPPTAPELVVN